MAIGRAGYTITDEATYFREKGYRFEPDMVILVSPLFALMGTLVVNNRMAFFSDAIGHASLTGIGLGVLLGLADPLFALVGFALLLGIGILAIYRLTRASMDTVISLSMSFSIASTRAPRTADTRAGPWSRRSAVGSLTEGPSRSLRRELARAPPA